MRSDETRYKFMRLLEVNQELGKRKVARTLGVSLGNATNYQEQFEQGRLHVCPHASRAGR